MVSISNNDILFLLPFAEAGSGKDPSCEGQGLPGDPDLQETKAPGRGTSMVSISINDILFLLPSAVAGSGEGHGLPLDPDCRRQRLQEGDSIRCQLVMMTSFFFCPLQKQEMVKD